MITKLRIQNFKCFEEEREIIFSRFNILYGKNGRGKSTVTQSLLMLSQNVKKKDTLTNDVSLKGELIDLGNYTDVLNRYTKSNQINIGISTDVDLELFLSYGKSKLGPTMLHMEDSWHGDTRLVSSVGTDGQDSMDTKNSGPMSGIKALETFRQLKYVSANRRGPTNYEERQDDFYYDDIGVNGERLINSLAKKSPEFIEKLQEALSYILSGATIHINNEENSDNIELLIDSMDDSLGFKPTNVGYGYSCVLPIIFQLLTASEGCSVIIENPEAHLYPGAQSRLVEWMVAVATEKQLQIIIETHSDHIINGLRIAIKNKNIDRDDVSIQFFDRKGAMYSPDILTIRVDANGTLSDNPIDFMDEWTRQMLALL